jgi:hypothetical protein
MHRVVAVIGALVIGLLAIGAIGAQYETAVTGTQPAQQVTNETFTVDVGTTHAFNESRRDVVYNDSVTVYQNSTEIDASEYRWQPGNGTLFVPSSSSMTDGESAKITYQYTEPTGEQRIARDVGLLPAQLGEGLGILAAAALLVGGFALLRRTA